MLKMNSLQQEAENHNNNCNNLEGQIRDKQSFLNEKPALIREYKQLLYNIENEIQGLASEKSNLRPSDPNYDSKVGDIDQRISEKRSTQQDYKREKTRHENEKAALSQRVKDLTFQLKLERGGRDRKLKDRANLEILYNANCQNR